MKKQNELASKLDALHKETQRLESIYQRKPAALAVRFTYSTNGQGIYGIDMLAGANTSTRVATVTITATISERVLNRELASSLMD